MDGTIGEIRFFSGNFAPSGWAFCQGQLLSISSYAALFTIVGTTFGGNGSTTFGLPDYRSRMPVGTGQGASLSAYNLGKSAGAETFTVAVGNMPLHTHAMTTSVTMSSNQSDGNTDNPIDSYPAGLAGTDMYSTTSDGSFMSNMQHNLGTSSVGSSTPVQAMQPGLVINFVICLQGIYPSRP